MNLYKSAPFVILSVFLLSSTATAQLKLGDMMKKAASSLSNPSSSEMGAGLKEALVAGVTAGSDRLSAKDGFLQNAAVKLLFPPEAKKVEKTLRGLGMNKLCDDFILSMNRAAEDAAQQAKPIFISAIKQMSFSDASSILLSPQKDAATTYFKNTTTDPLKAAFLPVIRQSLDKAGTAKYWTDITTAYNKIPLTAKINTDLNDYATQKSVDGLFYEVSQEELKIRTSSEFRSTPLMQKVFGWADKK